MRICFGKDANRRFVRQDRAQKLASSTVAVGRLVGRASQVDILLLLCYNKSMSLGSELATPHEGQPPLLDVEIKNDVYEPYSTFGVDVERLTALATDPEGPIRLTTDEVQDVLVEYDGKGHVGSLGVTATGAGTHGNLFEAIRNGRAGRPVSTVRASVGVRTSLDLRTPEEIESTTVHELVHVRQIKRDAMSLKLGLFMMKAGLVSGAIGVPQAVEALIQRDLPTLGFIVTGAIGALGGLRAGYQLAPHEREARKAQKETPYQGIVTAERNPDFVTREEKAEIDNEKSKLELQLALQELRKARRGET